MATDVITLRKEQRAAIGTAGVLRSLRNIVKVISIMGAVISLIVIFFAVKGYYSLPSADDYVDKGIYTFMPSRTYTMQEKYKIKISRSWQERSRSVNVVEYRAHKDGYRHLVKVDSKTDGQNLVREHVAIQRKIFSLKNTKDFITVGSEETTVNYTNRARLKYILFFSASAFYLCVFGGFYYFKNRKAKQPVTIVSR